MTYKYRELKYCPRHGVWPDRYFKCPICDMALEYEPFQMPSIAEKKREEGILPHLHEQLSIIEDRIEAAIRDENKAVIDYGKLADEVTRLHIPTFEALRLPQKLEEIAYGEAEHSKTLTEILATISKWREGEGR